MCVNVFMGDSPGVCLYWFEYVCFLCDFCVFLYVSVCYLCLLVCGISVSVSLSLCLFVCFVFVSLWLSVSMYASVFVCLCESCVVWCTKN